jgi:hypothetical protein
MRINKIRIFSIGIVGNLIESANTFCVMFEDFYQGDNYFFRVISALTPGHIELAWDGDFTERPPPRGLALPLAI